MASALCRAERRALVRPSRTVEDVLFPGIDVRVQRADSTAGADSHGRGGRLLNFRPPILGVRVPLGAGATILQERTWKTRDR